MGGDVERSSGHTGDRHGRHEVQPHRDGELQAVMRALSPNGSASDLFRALFDDAPVAYGLLGLDGLLVRGNHAYHELFGYEPGEMDGRSMLDLTYPDERDVTAAQMATLVSGEQTTYELDKRYVRKDGSVFWGHVIASTLCDSEGEPWGMLGAVEDISDRMDALAALAESELRFRALVQHAADPIVVTDAGGNLVFATPSTSDLSGADMDTMMGTSVMGWVHEDDRDVVAESFLGVVATAGAAVPLQLRIRRADGEVRFLEVVATNLLDDPAVGGIVLNLRDLTDTEVSRSALEMTETRFKHLVENISDTITLTDEHGHVLLSTGNLRSILGYDTSFWDDRNLFDVLHPDDVAFMTASLEEILRTPGKELAGEARIRDAHGQWVDVEINAVNLLDDESVRGIVLTTRNITARKHHEDELADARDQAVRALQMRTEFIASVSHELRTPIHGVLGLAELLETADLDDEARGLARSISRATESLRMVLDDILDFSKIEVGRLEINQEPVRLREVAKDLDALFGAQAAAKGTRLVIRKSDELPDWVVADGLRVRQVLNNLVGNAIKFTVEGEVVVSATKVTDDRGTDFVRVSVKDTGIGIAPEKHDRLFEPFSQAHQSTREYGGTGLGLSIARRLVELMGGTLEFSSRPGEGSEFWFTMPLVPLDVASEPHLADLVTHDRPAPASANVMVVEDNPINQLLVQRQLERLGYAAIVYDNGQAALDALPESSFDIVLMDWQLPGIDGLETTRRLRTFEREHERTPVPIVAMTASALPGDRNRCLDAGMDDFIAKPVSMVTLGRVIQRWCGPRPAADPAVDDREVVAAAGPVVAVEGGRPLDAGRAPTGLDLGALAAPVGPTAESTTVWSRPQPEPDVGATSLPVLDVAALDRLVDELADPLLVVTVARTYLRELPARRGLLADAIAADDRAALAAAAHTLKSTSAAVGATRLSDLCLRLEQTARLSATVPLPVSAAEVHAAAEDVVGELGRAVARLEATAATGASDVRTPIRTRL
jgi:PAS domain S-box-containing protein